MAALLDEPTYKIKLCVGVKPPPEWTAPYRNAIRKGNSKKDSGFDLFVPEDVTLPPGEITLINMFVSCAVYKNEEPCPFYMYSRSSTPIKYGLILANSVGIIDCGYRGPLMASFYNTRSVPVEIKRGTRLVQICMPDLSYDFSVELLRILDTTERGEGGFGSTGK
jgi:dUTP pyrophosphatase